MASRRPDNAEAAATRPAIDFDTYVPFGFTAIANKMSRGASRTYLRMFGVGINEWRILANLRVRPGNTANRICQLSGLDKAAVSRSLRTLETKGMIRTCGEGSDARGRPLRLTAKGDALHDGIYEVAMARQARLLDGFSAEERGLLNAFLKRLHANIALVNEDPLD